MPIWTCYCTAFACPPAGPRDGNPMNSARSAIRLLPLVLLPIVWSGCRETKASPAVAPPPEVKIITVAPERVALTSEWIATLDGYVNAQIRPQVSGYLLRRTYEEGTIVRKGQVLFEI